MKKNALKILIFIFIAGLPYSLFAQMYNYKQYTVANGFPQSNADDIFQDKDGYIWFATQNGAARFDGFNYFLVDKYKGLLSNNVVDINQDSEGNFWFSTKDGLTKYVNDSCINYTVGDGLSSNIVRNTFELPDHRILICTKTGTDIYENNKIRNLHLKDIPLHFIQRKNNEIWCVSYKNVYKFINDTLQKVSYNKLFSTFYFITEDYDSALWISSDKGIFKIKNDKILHLTEKKGLSDNKIKYLLVDSDNNLWYASEQNGCGKYFNGKFYNLTIETGMQNTSVLSLFEDDEKNIWIGGRNGATMINPRIPFVQFENVTPFEHEIVMGITNDAKGNLWFCTYGSGISKYDGKKFTNYTKKTGAFDNHFFDAETDINGKLWIASANSGILIHDKKGFKKIDFVDGEKINSRILTIYKDSENKLWFGTNGEGILVYDNKKLSRFFVKSDYPIRNVLAINEDDKENIWFGTVNEGLYKYDGKKIIRIDENNKISPGIVRAIANVNGKMWFGTASEGIYSLEQKNGKLIQNFINKSNGLNSDNVYLLFADSKKNLWCGTEKGVDKIKFKHDGNVLSIEHYTKNEGFLGVETDLNGAYEDKDGNIWFGTINGAVKYINNANKKNETEPKLFLKDIKLKFKHVNWLNYSDSVSSDHLPVNLKLAYYNNHLTFEFIGLCFSNPQKVRYTYRLIGQNNQWSPETGDRKAVFSNIAPGNYTFEVKASNDDGVWTEKPLSYSFEIQPPIWEEIWFKVVLLLLVLILIYSYIEFRNRNLKKVKVKLEEEVHKRTSELLNQKEEVEQINLKITDSINYARKIQSAMMPDINIFNNNFTDNFIFYQPRDIVSGDFYWAKEIRRGYDSHIVVVAADSTGHGIPGALVSMLGMSLLNEIVRKEEIQRANMVLEELRTEIKSSLGQKGDFDDQTEGIDMAVIVINKHTKEMQYSGANNPLYIVRKGELIILEPTINPVGIFLKELAFENKLFQLQEGDLLYLFSDGFEDQFNGKTGKKFKIKQFRELLLSIYNEPCSKQKQILEDTFYSWKGNYNQIDDVLIMGLKV